MTVINEKAGQVPGSNFI